MYEVTACAGDVDLWEKMITLNLITPMRLVRILAPHLAKRNPGEPSLCQCQAPLLRVTLL